MTTYKPKSIDDQAARLDRQTDAMAKPSAQSTAAGSGMSLEASQQALASALSLGQSDAVSALLAQPKNKPYYRCFTKARF